VVSSIVIKGDLEEIFAIARDMEKYPEFMEDVESVTVVERKARGTITDWVTNVEGTPICWREEDIYDLDNKKIVYRLLEGDLDKFEGEWRFVRTSEGTEVTLEVDYDFGIPSLTELIGPTLQIKVSENSEMMLQGMKKRIEGNN
jgi:ribosome-associated toxin RatA of RatAB toxin-antitoxin module